MKITISFEKGKCFLSLALTPEEEERRTKILSVFGEERETNIGKIYDISSSLKEYMSERIEKIVWDSTSQTQVYYKHINGYILCLSDLTQKIQLPLMGVVEKKELINTICSFFKHLFELSINVECELNMKWN